MVQRSVTSALVLLVCGGPLWAQSEVSIDLGASDLVQGIAHPQFIPDGNTIPVIMGGRDCRRNLNPGPGYPKDLFFYFTVDDAWAYRGSRPDVYITIIYYDTGSGPIQLEYDSSDFGSAPLNGAFKPGGSVTVAGTNTWKQHTFHVTDAWFGNRQQSGAVNADFRIRKDSGYFYLDSVRVSTQASWDGPLIGLSRTHFDHTVSCGQIPVDDEFTIRNIGAGQLNYAVSVDRPWVQVSPESGSSTGQEDTITLSYGQVGGLGPGWHFATVSVFASDGNAGNQPQTLTVTFFVETEPADFDRDCDIDQSDYSHLQACLGQPCSPGSPCAGADLNDDGRCNAQDASLFHQLMSGPNTYQVDPAGSLPQYIFFNKSSTAQGAYIWHQNNPGTFTPESCQELVQILGTAGNANLRIGVSFAFSILDTPVSTLAQSLQNLLGSATATDLPVLITLDGQNWWQTRYDLWNWWDQNLPGFNPNNRYNVEWTDWSPDSAVKIGWRNWGYQIRVRPEPNLASPKILAEYWARYDVLVPIIRDWYRNLPSNRKYLFGGTKVGWEASIGVNAYYHENGNYYFEQWPNDTSHDPDPFLHDASQGWTWGLPVLGHAAAVSSGIKQSGELAKEDVEQIVRQYLERLSEAVYQRGIPRHLIFTHQGGTYYPWHKHLSFKPAINDYSIPGWSFYSHDPQYCGSLAADLDAAGRQQWAASEWWRDGVTQSGWRDRFQAALEFKQCRLVCVYNWEQFKHITAARAAIRDLVLMTE